MTLLLSPNPANRTGLRSCSGQRGRPQLAQSTLKCFVRPHDQRPAAREFAVRRFAGRAQASSDASISAPGEDAGIQDELGDLAAQIGALGKEVDAGLSGTSIFLVGMMGSGKSTAGKLLASVLQYCFFDTDAVIRQAAGGAPISEIFADSGEEEFRNIESSVLRELSAYRNCVIATGGGAVIRPTNWGSMQVGVTVYLKGSVEQLERRIAAQDGGASRPLLATTTNAEASSSAMKDKLTAILAERRQLYESADCTVVIDDDEAAESPVRITYAILSAINQKIKESAAERNERRRFTINDQGPVPVGTPIQQTERLREE